jgi:peptide/nickel transport system substrate-binding protein
MLAACAGGGSTSTSVEVGEPQRGGDIVAGIRSNPPSLDPARCGARIYWQHCQPIYGTLMRYNQKAQKFEPALAESFESEDGKSWTLKLKEGITFTDGTRLDAAAVDYNWKRAKDPATLSAALYWLSQMTWQVVDGRTISIQLEEPNYQLPWAMQFELGFIGSPKALKELGESYSSAPVGAGPFVFKKLARDSELSFTRNDNYVEKDLPYIDNLTLKIIASDTVRVDALRTSEIDINNTFLSKDAKILTSEGYPGTTTALWGGTGLAFNFKDPDIGDRDLRLALQSAMDVAQISSASYPGDEVPSAWFPTTSRYRDDAAGVFPEHDLNQAQKLLDDYLSKTGKTSLSLSIATYAEFPTMLTSAQQIQAQLMKLKGLDITVEPLTSQALGAKVASGKFQLATRTAGGSQVPTELVRFFKTGGDLNITGYSNPRVDDAFRVTQTSTDPEKVTEAWKTVGGELSKDAPIRLFAQEADYLNAAKNVQGVNAVSVGSQSSELLWLSR